MPDWRDRAKCAQLPEAELEAMFYPSKQGASLKAAKAFCRGTDYDFGCPVREHCLAWALALPGSQTDVGVWGGLSARELREMRKERSA